MAENINISFAPNKAASESQRIADLEQYVSTLTERTKFAFASIIEEYNGADTDKTQQILNTIYQSTSESGSDVGKFTNTDKNSEIFNDYENNVATAPYSHAEGYRTSAKGLYSHAEGYSTVTSNDNAHAEGSGTEASGNTSHAEGSNTKATGWVSHAEGDSTIASGMYSHAEGGKSESKAKYSHAEGESTQATGYASHAEGESCIASGNYSHAGGLSSEASGKCSYTGGELGTASGDYSHTEGLSNTASGAYSYALGKNNTASGGCSIAGGVESKAKDPYAIAYGYKCVAGTNSMAIGSESEATNYSYAFGTGLKAYMQTVAFGMYNKETNARFVIGGGTADNPFDVLWVDRECNLHVAGKVIADGGAGYVLPSATADTLGGVKIGDNISVTADGTISVDLSAYLKSADISDWAKQSDKPTYTASEIGLGNVDNTADADKPISTATQKALDGKADTGHTHTVSDITDMPAYLTEETDPTVPDWAKAESKPAYTAEEVGAAAKSHTHTKSQITDFPASLPANGGNADTVDGKHASDFATDITAAVNAISIGGRNIVTGSAKLTIGAGKRPKGHWRQSGPVTLASTSASGVPYADDLTACVLTATTINASGGLVQDGVPLSKDEYYTLSCWVKNTSAKSVKFILQPFWKSSSDFDRKVFILNESAEWQRISYTSSKKPKTSDVYGAGAVLLNADTVGASIQVCGVKLEKGNKPTDWTPAPEDDERRITSLEARVAALEAMAVSGGE